MLTQRHVAMACRLCVTLHVVSQNLLLTKNLKVIEAFQDHTRYLIQLFAPFLIFNLKPFSSRFLSTGEHYFQLLESTRTSHCFCWYQGSTFKSNKTYGNPYLSVTMQHAKVWNKLQNLCQIFSLTIWILFGGVFRTHSNIYDGAFCESC